MDEMKKKRDLLFIEEEKESKPKPGQAFNPLLTQEERHRQINE